MRRAALSILPPIAVVLVLAGCGGSSSTTATSSASTTGAAVASSAVTLSSRQIPSLHETVLVNSRGLTLYTLKGESASHILCTGACVTTWPPLLGSSAGGAPSLAVTSRPEGSQQVTYRGMPLYTFAGDSAPGQANGQGLDGGTWKVATTSGASSGGAAATSSNGGGY